MGNFLVAVGGTGQLVALSYLRLAALCGFKPEKIFLVDSDIASPITHYITQEYHDYIKICKPIPNYVQNNTNFKGLFLNLGDGESINSVLSMLFTNDELNILVDRGMYGSPCVGATALMTKIKSETLLPHDDDPNYISLIEMTNMITNDDSNVTICGSIVGGTGSGGVSTIAKEIKTKSKERNKNAKIVIIDFLSWFRLENNNDKDKSFQKNSESGVYFLKDEIAMDVRACILLGLQNPLDVNPEKIGEQKEKLHLITLLAAVIANNSFYCQKLFPVPNSFYSYKIPDGGLKTSDVKVYMPVGNIGRETSVSLDNVIKMAKYIVGFLDYFNKLGYALDSTRYKM